MPNLEALLRAAGEALAVPTGPLPPLAERLVARVAGVDLDHLHLAVSDLDASADFYSRWFGLAGEVVDGTLFARNGAGFLLCLTLSADALPLGGAHFGFTLAEVDRLRELHSAMAAARLEVSDLYEEPGYAAFRVLDPDGNSVEVFVE